MTDLHPPRPRVWTLAAALAVLFVGMVVLGRFVLQGYFLLSSRAVLAGGPLPGQDQFLAFYDTLSGFLFAATISAGWMGVVAIGAALLSPVPLGPRLGLTRSRLGRLGWILVPLGALALNQAVDAGFHLTGFGRGDALEDLLRKLAGARGPMLALSLLIVGTLSATCEELFFRGYLQRRLVARFGAVPGIVFPALLFGLAHFDLHHGLFAFLFGMFIGVAAWAADSTWPAIVAHVVNNTVSVLAQVVGLDTDPTSPRAQWLTLLLGTAGALAATAWIVRRGRHARALARARADAPAPEESYA